MLKVLHVVASMDAKTGGVAQAVRSLIRGQAGLGHAHEVVTVDDPARVIPVADVFEMHALGPHATPWCYSPRLLPWLLQNLSRFDGVILHGLWLSPSHLVVMALNQLRRRGKRVPRYQVMPHGMLDPYFQKVPSRRLKALRNWLYWKLIEARVVRDADGMLFTCEQELRLARQSFLPYQPKCEDVIGLGVETPPAYVPAMAEAFHAACPALAGRPYLLFLARIHPKKGVEGLIRAYQSLWRQAAESDTGQSPLPALVIAGPLDSAHARQMQALASLPMAAAPGGFDRRMSARPFSAEAPPIFFPGMLEGDAKWGAFYECEAFLLPSHQENFGIAVVEALACSKPVLISDQVNIWREVEADGAALVAPDTLDGTQSLLRRWLALSDTERAAMGRDAQRCFESKFEIGRAAERLLQKLKR